MGSKHGAERSPLPGIGMVVAIVFEIGGEGEIEVKVDEVRLVVVNIGVRSGIEDRCEC